MLITDEFVFFYGRIDVFSNWYPSPFSIYDYKFKNSEQAMMFAKAQFFNYARTAYEILDEPDPAKAKALGRKVNNYDDRVWAENRLEIVADILYHKFKSTEDLTEIILATGDRMLVEASPSDTIWGIGMSINHPDIFNILKWQGENLLGKALMIARTRLEDEQD